MNTQNQMVQNLSLSLYDFLSLNHRTQRQSLGSPGSNQAAAASFSLAGGAPDSTDETKAEKLIRSTSSRLSRTVHLIPILIVVCFLILYLISHEPSPIDFPVTRGIERIIEPNAGLVSGFVSAAMRTKRGLMEEIKRIRITNRRLGLGTQQ